jgi:hypothetical protein
MGFMSKQQMIDAIQSHSRGAGVEFLIHFNEEQLQKYLNRLTQVVGHRGRMSIWVRQSESRAVVTRRCA